MAQPQDVSYFTHGQPLVRHRDALPKYRENPTAVGCPASLSSGAQTSCTVPVRTAKAISFRPESPITLRRNRRSLCAGIRDHFGPESARTVRAARDSGPRVDRSASRTHRRAARHAGSDARIDKRRLRIADCDRRDRDAASVPVVDADRTEQTGRRRSVDHELQRGVAIEGRRELPQLRHPLRAVQRRRAERIGRRGRVHRHRRRAGRRAKRCPTDLLLACHGEVLAEPTRGRSRKCVHVHCPVELCYGRNRDHGLAHGGQCDLERYIATPNAPWTDRRRTAPGGTRATWSSWGFAQMRYNGSIVSSTAVPARGSLESELRAARDDGVTNEEMHEWWAQRSHDAPTRRDQCAAQSADDRGLPYAHQGSYRLRRNGMRSNAQVRAKRSTTHLRKTPRTGCETPANRLRKRCANAHVQRTKRLTDGA